MPTAIGNFIDQALADLFAQQSNILIRKIFNITVPENVINELKIISKIYLEEKLEVPVYTAEEPLTCVANGTGILLDKIHYIDY